MSFISVQEIELGLMIMPQFDARVNSTVTSLREVTLQKMLLWQTLSGEFETAPSFRSVCVCIAANSADN